MLSLDRKLRILEKVAESVVVARPQSAPNLGPLAQKPATPDSVVRTPRPVDAQGAPAAQIANARPASPLGRAMGTESDMATVVVPKLNTAITTIPTGGTGTQFLVNNNLPLTENLSLGRSTVVSPTTGKISPLNVQLQYGGDRGFAGLSYNPQSGGVGVQGNYRTDGGGSVGGSVNYVPTPGDVKKPMEYQARVHGRAPVKDALGPFRDLALAGSAGVSGGGGDQQRYDANLGFGGRF